MLCGLQGGGDDGDRLAVEEAPIAPEGTQPAAGWVHRVGFVPVQEPWRMAVTDHPQRPGWARAAREASP